MLPALVLSLALTPDAAATLVRAAEADLRLRQAGTCVAADLDLVRSGLKVLEELAGLPPSVTRWRFPVDRVAPSRSIGGRDGSGFVLPRRLRCYADSRSGHAAHDLFVPDPDADSRDEHGAPWRALAVEDGLVLLAQAGWTPGNPLKGGNFVLVYIPARRQLAYYAHLESVAVAAGVSVRRGDTLGLVGRTGLNAWQRRSPTHLHFGLIDASSLMPVNPYDLLKEAE